MNKQSSFLSKAEIMDAAEQTLRRFGPDKTSVTDVAKLLGVSHGTLYRHFPSKAVLREAVTERWLEEKIIAPLSEIVRDESEAVTPLQQVRLYILKLMELKHSHAKDDPEMFKMYASVTAEAAELVDVHINHLVEHLSLILSRGLEHKSIQSLGEPEKMAHLILLATTRFHHPSHAKEWQKTSIQEDFNLLWMLMEQGLAV